MKFPQIFLGPCIAIIALTGCGSSLESTTSGGLPGSTVTADSPDNTSVSTFEPEVVSDDSAPSYVEAAYHLGASHQGQGIIPQNARNMESFKTPSENILCFLDDDPVCSVLKPGVTVKLNSSSPYIIDYVTNQFINQVGLLPEVSYGEIVYNGDTACVIEQVGITCWNSQTNHGAFLSRENTATF